MQPCGMLQALTSIADLKPTGKPRSYDLTSLPFSVRHLTMPTGKLSRILQSRHADGQELRTLVIGHAGMASLVAFVVSSTRLVSYCTTRCIGATAEGQRVQAACRRSALSEQGRRCNWFLQRAAHIFTR